MRQVEKDWWQSDVGYVRRVVWKGRTRYVSWRHFEPVQGYFDTFEEAASAIA